MLGRGLITRGLPQPDRRKLFECKVAGSQLVIAHCNATALLVEEALDPVAVERGAEIDRYHCDCVLARYWPKRLASWQVSAGKLQKAGVQADAERRTLNTVVRAPGTVQEEECRKAVVSLRFEAFIDSVENVTTGSHVNKGQRLMRIYGRSLLSAAAEYLSALNARPDTGIANQALKGARRRLENLGAPEAFIAEIERTREARSTRIGLRRWAARSWNAWPSTACALAPAMFYSESQITTSSGCWSISPNATCPWLSSDKRRASGCAPTEPHLHFECENISGTTAPLSTS